VNIELPRKCLDSGYLAHMITLRCNGNCPYCIVEGRGTPYEYPELSGKDVLSIWNNLKSHNGKRLSIIGGECTLHQDFMEIVQGLIGYNVTITTNLATKFYDDPNFWKAFKVNYPIRVNTSYHPCSGLSPERYVEIVNTLRKNGINVDQTGMVEYPGFDSDKWKKKFSSIGFNGIRMISFLGFWSKDGGFINKKSMKTEMNRDNLYPKATGLDAARILRECGIDDMDRYFMQCGQPMDSNIEWNCPHGSMCFLVAPDGTVHECHHKLYHNIDPLGNALTGFSSVEVSRICGHFGKCSWCDIPRLVRSGYKCKI